MLKTENLGKKYGDFSAVENLNLEVKEGSVFGFLGHNGAGKTTTISMLTTLILPTSGKAAIGGYDVVKDNLKVRNLIGYLPENVTLYGDLTAVENLRFFGRLSGVENVDARIEDTLKLLDFTDWKNRKVKTYSKGMRQRIGIAQAILHSPKILFLDEPTSGLDPQGTKELRDILLMLNQERGTTIFMNTHLLSEVTKLCTDIGIISKGRLLLADSIKNIEKEFPEEKSLEEIYFKIEGGK
ncbi:ABC transporter ATP-binding protein [Parasporobacterium paucivorans]|uniref:ABC-2 type transport system ATP-binding protein n=1 Tax=Parasporobacterium paucivorans DSM 15970 TaxID=1122934 RepID=A0A1M6D1B1_9FIRM|nr:ABC transporter ATP-binding protein [Parasporobacterium paucivorans]SHI67010.1 ABC-2 type transport system ATP-binding protein [Parasporobacterium paucivorans DSM 15970]